MEAIYEDRVDAGQRLARALEHYAGPSTLVLGIPRGGVVVAAEVAHALGAPLDVVIARKIGAPHQPELAIGAVVSGEGGVLLDEAALRYFQVPAEFIQRETARQEAEIRRQMELYRGDRPAPEVRGKTVIVVDDGIATGYTLRAALVGLRRQNPGRLVVAAPVGPGRTCAEFREVADDVVCLRMPEPFIAVGAWYAEFGQTEDAEVVRLLASQSTVKGD
jgi:predicted phosphoribosyltransferase